MKRSLGFSTIPMLVLVFLCVAGFLIFLYLFKRPPAPEIQFPNYDNESSSTPTEVFSNYIGEDAEIVSVDDLTNKYVNKTYGFEATYPKFNLTTVDCLGNIGEVALKLFDVPDKNTFYIADEKFIYVFYKETPNGGYVNDPTTCEVKDTNLDYIVNGYDAGGPDPLGLGVNIRSVSAFQILFEKIVDENELNALVAKKYPGCFAGEMTPLLDNDEVFVVELVDENGRNDLESNCWTNFIYMFYYAKSTGTAVLTSGYQAASFNGTNGQYEPSIEFISSE